MEKGFGVFMTLLSALVVAGKPGYYDNINLDSITSKNTSLPYDPQLQAIV